MSPKKHFSPFGRQESRQYHFSLHPPLGGVSLTSSSGPYVPDPFGELLAVVQLYRQAVGGFAGGVGEVAGGDDHAAAGFGGGQRLAVARHNLRSDRDHPAAAEGNHQLAALHEGKDHLALLALDGI